MKVKFWGTRGSIAKAGPATVRFGGNTSCVEIRSSNNTLIIVDCGTGGHGLGQHLMKTEKMPIKGHILISHTHWDHIQGIPFFAPLFVPGCEWDIYAPRGLGASLEEALAGQMQYTYFPVRLENLGATIRYHELVEGSFTVDDVTIKTHYLNHPALTLGYRIIADGVSAVYCCDHEPFSREFALGEGPMSEQDRNHVHFLDKADMVIHDAQYTTEEYRGKMGWGHTTISAAVTLCDEAHVRQLALTHHDPMRTDDDVDRLVAEAKASLVAKGSTMEVFGAAEGKTIHLVPADKSDDGRKSGNTSALDGERLQLTAQVLVHVADEPLKKSLLEALEACELSATVVSTCEAVEEAFKVKRPALVVVDRSAVEDGVVDAVGRLREMGAAQETPVIGVASLKDASFRDKKVPNITDWLVEPFTTEFARSKLQAWTLRRACRWIPAEEPHNESDRIDALHSLGVVDTPLEERFDCITRIAATAFDTPIALFTLVDKNRQWFKSAYGFDVRETPRDQSFSAHAIAQDTPLIIPDAREDDRFADNPLVTRSPCIRFYAGIPVRAGADRHKVGTLCVIDVRPRKRDSTMDALLEDLVTLIEEELESDPNGG